MARDLPEGTVTLLFTDIEGSTKLLRSLGEEAYAEALLEHRQALRSAFARYGGVEVDTQGDALFIVFPSASSGVEAAREAQEALAAGPIRVRMGLHTGAPRLTEEGYVGPDVHEGARIAAAGHGGQVLMSRETRDLVSAEVTDLGEHRLKDFDEPIWIFQLGPERFPPLKTISNTNLPRPASSFIGRQREVDEVVSLLTDRARLLTLTGPGGSGKTRLAVEAAAELLPEFRNGVFWVNLAPLRDPSLVVESIQQALGIKVDLPDHVGERELLVLLDNFEQVVEAGSVLTSLLEACRNLKLLVTSREALRVSGEVQYRVPPLAEPEAIGLFCARAGTDPDETVGRLCQALEDLPLAIELAAARTSVLSPRQILDRISERLDLLKAGRGAGSRQASLRATIDWSYGLLQDEEKDLFARLAVFRASSSLVSLQQVADADLDTLQSLVEKNLLRHGGERFWMLETIREHADERLELSGEADVWRTRHAHHFLTMAEEAEPHFRAESAGWPERLEPDHDNLRAALEHLERSGETQLALQLAGAVWRFWFAKGHLTEGWRRMKDLLRADESPTAARARALIGAAMLATNGGDSVTARAWAEESIALHHQLGNPQGAADAQLVLGFSFAAEGALEQAHRGFDESARAFRDLGDEHYELVATRMLVWALHELGDGDRARALGEENLRRARALGDVPAEAMTLGGLAIIAADDGQFDEALSMLRQSIRLFHDLGDLVGITFDLCRLAHVYAVAGRAESAALLLASSETLSDDIGANVPWYERMRQETLATIRAELDEAALADAMQRGRALHAEEAVTLVLEHLD